MLPVAFYPPLNQEINSSLAMEATRVDEFPILTLHDLQFIPFQTDVDVKRQGMSSSLLFLFFFFSLFSFLSETYSLGCRISLRVFSYLGCT